MRSSVEIYFPETGESRVVWQTDRLFEAPNFTADGKSLILNADGLLYRLPLDGGEPVEIDTGLARSCNNDHGLSPDGATIVISDKTEYGASTIYTLPIGGGTPRQVTKNLPSTGMAGRRMAAGSPIAASATMSSISTRSTSKAERRSG